MTGKGVLIWTHPGSQGWRPVGGLVLHGALLEVGIDHKFVYGAADDPRRDRRDRQLLPGGHMKQLAEYVDDRHVRRTRHGPDLRRSRSQPVDAAVRRRHRLPRHDRADPHRPGDLQPTNSPRCNRASRSCSATCPSRTSSTSDRCGCIWPSRSWWTKNGWDFYTIQSFPGLGDDYSATCFAQSMMLEDGCGTSTLGDFNTALTRALAHQAEPGAGLLRRPAAHRQEDQ